jgi:hypothetical protein
VRGNDTLRLEPVRLGGVDHAIAHEAGQRLIFEVLQLAPAAGTEMAAPRRGVVRARLQCAADVDHVARRCQRNMAARRGDAIASRGDADYRIRFGHSAVT